MTRRVHLDVDPGCDDAVMMAMALAAPDLSVEAVSTVAGNSTVENTTRNALAILEFFDRTDVPVAKGAGQPLNGTFSTAEWVHGPEGIRGDLPDPSTEPVDVDGAELMLRQARRHGDELTIVAVGPLTNLAIALAREPSLPELVADIYVMGGAAFVPGNVTPVAEANVHNDPIAARRVVQSGRPHLVGLDVTRQATVSLETIADYRDGPTPRDTVAAWLEYPESVRTEGESDLPAIHDAAVVAHLVDDAVLGFDSYYADVDTTDGPSRGNVVCDRWGVTEEAPNADVAVEIDTERYRAILADAVERLTAAADS
jgi:inosine-uridine nucleoside N-ribohydrolase